jgi:hypothetical protein
MFFTIFTYEGHDKHLIIHRKQAEQYAADLATYPEFFTVTRKPTLQEAEVIFSICKPGNLCSGIKSAKTEKLT